MKRGTGTRSNAKVDKNKNDMFWYVMIALGVVAFCIIAAIFSPSRWTDDYDNWVEFALLTLVLFGYLIKWNWRSRGNAKFWGTYAVLLLAHCIVLIPVFSHFGRLSIVLCGAIATLEGMALIMVMSLALGNGPRI